MIGATELFVPLAGLIDLDKEREKLRREAERVGQLLASTSAKLTNENFISRAPAEVIEKERSKVENYREALERLRKNLAQLGG